MFMEGSLTVSCLVLSVIIWIMIHLFGSLVMMKILPGFMFHFELKVTESEYYKLLKQIPE